MALVGSCIQIPTSTRVDLITSQSLFLVDFPSSTVLSTVVPNTLFSLGPAAIQFGSRTIPVRTSVFTVTSTSTLDVVVTHTETLFGVTCNPSPAAAPTPSAAVTTTAIVDNSISTSISDPPEALSVAATTTTQVLTQSSQGTGTSSATQTIIAPSTASLQTTGGSSSDDTEKRSVTDSHMAAIVGGSVGGCVVIVAALLLAWYLLRRRRRASQNWDGVFKDNWAGRNDDRPEPKIITSRPRATLVPFPHDASPTSEYRDAKDNNRARQPSLIQSPATEWSQRSFVYHHPSGLGSQDLTYPQYQYSESGHAYDNGGYVKPGELGARPLAPSLNSFSMNPYDGVSPVVGGSPEGRYHINNGSMGSSSSASHRTGDITPIDAIVTALAPREARADPFSPVSRSPISNGGKYQPLATSKIDGRKGHIGRRRRQSQSSDGSDDDDDDTGVVLNPPPSYTEA